MNKKQITFIVVAAVILIGGALWHLKNRQSTVRDNVDGFPRSSEEPKTTLSEEKIYTDKMYGYRFEYPQEWEYDYNPKNGVDGNYNVMLLKKASQPTEGMGQDNIQIVKVTSDAYSSEKLLNEFSQDKQYQEIPTRNGKAYFFMGDPKSKVGSRPAAYLVGGNNEIFLMGYNPYSAFNENTLLEAKDVVLKIVSTFEFKN